MFTTLLVLGIVVTVYHGYKAYVRYVNSSPMFWISANFLKPSGLLDAIRGSVGAEKSGEVPDGPPRLICPPPIASRGT